MTKEQIRKAFLERRRSLSKEQVEHLSSLIQERLMKAPFWLKTGKLGLYASTRNEVMTYKVFQKALEAGLHVFFPRVEQGIEFYEVNGPEDLQKGSWGISEPKRHCLPLATEESLDLLIVPGIAFTRDCYRIGYGQGFYDQYLEHVVRDIPAIGLAYEFQLVDEFPKKAWDRVLSGVMTEKSFYSRD